MSLVEKRNNSGQMGRLLAIRKSEFGAQIAKRERDGDQAI